MSTVTDVSRAHSDLADRMINEGFIGLFSRTLRQFFSISIPMLSNEAIDSSGEVAEQATELLAAININVGRAVRGCRTYMLDASLAQSIAALIDTFPHDSQRLAPPEPTGFVWLDTPLMLPHAMGSIQRVDAMTWSTIDVLGGDHRDDLYHDNHRRFICLWWAHTGNGRGEDTLTEFIQQNAFRRTGREFDYATEFGPWRLGGATHVAEHHINGPARIEVSDDDLDALAASGQELVYTESPAVNPILSAIWGLLTGKLHALDGAGERETVAHDEEPNRASLKRARRNKRPSAVHTVSLGRRREYAPTAEHMRGTRGPIGVQYYVPGFYRRPPNSGPDHPRTVWVEGRWRGDPEAPVSQNSTVYVARAPREPKG